MNGVGGRGGAAVRRSPGASAARAPGARTHRNRWPKPMHPGARGPRFAIRASDASSAMAVLPVYKFPHPVLKQQARPVTRFDEELRLLSENMLETMYEEGGIGLAANQVGQLRRLIVMDLHAEDETDGTDEPDAADAAEPGSKAGGKAGGKTGAKADARPRAARPRQPQVFVNPTLVEASGEMVTEEGCLSVVDFTAEVKRARRIVLAWQNLQGEQRRQEFEELAAVCLQHELDHLAGKLFIDHLPPLKRQLVKKRLAKLAQSA
jgi:peptide deformylase